jgi:hypothetical protein
LPGLRLVLRTIGFQRLRGLQFVGDRVMNGVCKLRPDEAHAARKPGGRRRLPALLFQLLQLLDCIGEALGVAMRGGGPRTPQRVGGIDGEIV